MSGDADGGTEMDNPLGDNLWLPLTQTQIDALNAGELVTIEVPRVNTFSSPLTDGDPQITKVMIRRMLDSEHNGQ
jgi:hypothetical protein